MEIILVIATLIMCIILTSLVWYRVMLIKIEKAQELKAKELKNQYSDTITKQSDKLRKSKNDFEKTEKEKVVWTDYALNLQDKNKIIKSFLQKLYLDFDAKYDSEMISRFAEKSVLVFDEVSDSLYIFDLYKYMNDESYKRFVKENVEKWLDDFDNPNFDNKVIIEHILRDSKHAKSKNQTDSNKTKFKKFEKIDQNDD